MKFYGPKVGPATNVVPAKRQSLGLLVKNLFSLRTSGTWT